MKPGVKLEGVPELEGKLQKIANNLHGEKVSREFMPIAEMVRDHIKSGIPRGTSGNLARSVVAKALDPRKFVAVVIAAIDRKIAPHAHLLEFGTSRMSAQPFFRPGWDSIKGRVEDMVKKKLKHNVEKVI